MFLWFVGASVVVVWTVFRSPAVDYRMVMAGSVLPLVELAAGRPLLLHTLAGVTAVLVVVMATTSQRRLRRRRWLGLPIGLYLHLALDGVWTDRGLFWWPAFGLRFGDRPLLEVGRGGWNVVLEVAGLVALGWMVRRFELTDAERRRRFWRRGQLDRDLAA